MNTTARIKRRRPMALLGIGARVLAFLLILVSLALAVMSRTHPKIIADIRVAADTIVAPVLILVGRPLNFFLDVRHDIESYLSVRERNQQLEARVKNLVTLEQTLQRLRSENALLHEQLNVTKWPIEVLATGRVIGAEGGPFFQSVLVDAGVETGARLDASVVDKAGVVGRLVNAGRLTSRVLLMTDLNSRIPVRIERTQETGILVGDNTKNPKIQFLPLNAELRAGDRVVTSGHGGVFPPDLPVGTIVFNDNDLTRVRPFAELSQLNFLTIVSLPMEYPVEDNAREENLEMTEPQNENALNNEPSENG